MEMYYFFSLSNLLCFVRFFIVLTSFIFLFINFDTCLFFFFFLFLSLDLRAGRMWLSGLVIPIQHNPLLPRQTFTLMARSTPSTLVGGLSSSSSSFIVFFMIFNFFVCTSVRSLFFHLFFFFISSQVMETQTTLTRQS